jgi:hypothetical protein
MTNHSEHVKNASGFRAGCLAQGQTGFLETNYAGKVSIRGTEDGYAGGDSPDLYAEGMHRNVDAFHRAITQGDASNPTLEPSIQSNLAVLLAREVCLRGRPMTWEELLADTRRLRIDTSGLRP